MANGSGERKVGLVTFNNEVNVVGDGTQQAQNIAGDKLTNFDFLLENGKTQASSSLSKSIKDTKEALQKNVMAIQETGPTALGPALLTSVAMALNGKAGSQVVICTDGLSNIGLGSFDGIKDDK